MGDFEKLIEAAKHGYVAESEAILFAPFIVTTRRCSPTTVAKSRLRSKRQLETVLLP